MSPLIAPSRIASTLGLVAFGLASQSWAVDGVLEINQTCAVKTGCFAGDTAGFPVEIAVTGSYRLTDDLTVPDGNTTAISLPVNIRATIDLNGFEIRCSGACLSGTGHGIDGGSLGQRMTVVNGSVSFMGGKGIIGATGTIIDRVRIENNRAGGVVAGNLSRITNSDVRNLGNGIECGDNCIVSHNSVGPSGGDGISVGTNSSVVGNIVSSSSGVGIRAGSGGTIAKNSVRLSNSHGIESAGDSVISGNSVRDNDGTGIWVTATAGQAGSRIEGNAAINNQFHGIEADYSVISNNVCNLNGSYGIRALYSSVLGNTANANTSVGLSTGFGVFASGYANNQFYSNNGGGAQVVGGLEIGTNVCHGDTICP